MHSEWVDLQELSTGDYRVRITYRFQGRLFSPLTIVFPEPKEYTLNGFTRSWNGASLPVERIQADRGYGFYLANNKDEYIAKHVSTLPRTLGNDSVLVDEYTFTPPHWEPGTKSDLDPGKYVEYILVTGSVWIGHIERILVTVQLNNKNCRRIQVLEDSYWGDCNEEGIWKAELKNTNPHKNIRLVVSEKIN